MTHALFSRIRETSTTTGIGSYALAGAVTGFKTFASRYSTGDTLYYCAQMGADFEEGYGTFTSPGTLARTTIIASSNGDAAVNWAAGTKDIFVTLPGTKTYGKLIGMQVFAASGTWTKPAGCRAVVVEVKGAGGGGGGVSNAAALIAAAGGSEGGRTLKRITSPGATEAVTVGVGGTAGSAAGGAGGAGSSSSFGAHCSATGGDGGGGATTSGGVNTGGAGTGFNGDVNTQGQTGGIGIGIPGAFTAGGHGGGSGGGWGFTGVSLPGVAGVNGGGGSGAVSAGSAANAGGAGGNGFVYVWEYE